VCTIVRPCKVCISIGPLPWREKCQLSNTQFWPAYYLLLAIPTPHPLVFYCLVCVGPTPPPSLGIQVSSGKCTQQILRSVYLRLSKAELVKRRWYLVCRCMQKCVYLVKLGHRVMQTLTRSYLYWLYRSSQLQDSPKLDHVAASVYTYVNSAACPTLRFSTQVYYYVSTSQYWPLIRVL
jgi:hypothetical protein